MLNYLNENEVINITFTGGEPLLQDNINNLINILIDHSYSVDIAPFINGTITYLYQN
ncbi:4Fe-4S cluster-binding domain-containing protein [Thomasclavelia spiroformis]|uniref:4Fe-4S cluster-binding domain-containing protein n=1 Tax=Thomasclavelia spiroformis TaxID=29348 RepID=A0A3E5FN31_9FIRM|nr:4Fe-4S cluster-binding domain-containing protein [Thomasclavelia spiroformis]RGO07616.1 4Fe-4S cluster-binding domain-containing protein [Thomasclavelia spiroformis]